MSKLKSIIAISDLVFPDNCIVCNSSYTIGHSAICRHCISDLNKTHFELSSLNPMERQLSRTKNLVTAWSLYLNRDNKIKKVLHHIKYGNGFRLAYLMGRIMGRAMIDGDLEIPEVIIPVPDNIHKRIRRGYNQVLPIAKGISRELKIPIEQKALKRRLSFVDQARLSRKERLEVAKRSYRIDQKPSCNHVLLIDDTFTTGATMQACYDALVKGGIDRVSVISLAYTPR